MTGQEEKQNRLISEKSPYLLQHAYNPVEWYPWGEEAFEKAEKEDKPLFLSIGYSTCHWCHVMAHESFEDDEVADLMNQAFVNIKVDREERPDIDKVYMEIAQMMTGRGGWPLTIIMTPEKEPFYAATYIPKESRYGQPGMMELVPRLKEIWQSDRANISDVTSRIKDALSEKTAEAVDGNLGIDDIETAFSLFSSRFDDRKGGFGSAPKFPSPHNLMFLLRYWKRTGDDWALHMVERTLRAMRDGGIFDHIGYGFHRYSTDANWLLPHFEKMLYDQALLLFAYLEAFEATRKPEYARVCTEIIEYVLRDMTSKDGAFFSAEDADSEGVEGKFYVWSSKEIEDALSKKEAAAFRKMYNIRPEGNFREEATGEETKQNIPHVTRTTDDLAEEMGEDKETLMQTLESARQKLFSVREKRIRPHLDDKILTDWNGLLIAALAKAGRVLDNSDFVTAAERATEFVRSSLTDDQGRLLHRFRDGESIVTAFLDDHAFFVWGLLELYESTFDPKYLEMARNMTNDQITYFWDESGGAFFFTAHDSEDLLVRKKEAYDGAIPSGNSVSMLNLIRLARLLGDNELESKAGIIGETFSSEVSRMQTAYSFMLVALDYALGPSHEIVIAGEASSDYTMEMLRSLRERFLPSTVVLLRPGGDVSKQLNSLAPFSKFMDTINDEATAHVCTNHNCKLPTNNIKQMLELLGEEETVAE